MPRNNTSRVHGRRWDVSRQPIPQQKRGKEVPKPLPSGAYTTSEYVYALKDYIIDAENSLRAPSSFDDAFDHMPYITGWIRPKVFSTEERGFPRIPTAGLQTVRGYDNKLYYRLSPSDVRAHLLQLAVFFRKDQPMKLDTLPILGIGSVKIADVVSANLDPDDTASGRMLVLYGNGRRARFLSDYWQPSHPRTVVHDIMRKLGCMNYSQLVNRRYKFRLHSRHETALRPLFSCDPGEDMRIQLRNLLRAVRDGVLRSDMVHTRNLNRVHSPGMLNKDELWAVLSTQFNRAVAATSECPHWASQQQVFSTHIPCIPSYRQLWQRDGAHASVIRGASMHAVALSYGQFARAFTGNMMKYFVGLHTQFDATEHLPLDTLRALYIGHTAVKRTFRTVPDSARIYLQMLTRGSSVQMYNPRLPAKLQGRQGIAIPELRAYNCQHTGARVVDEVVSVSGLGNVCPAAVDAHDGRGSFDATYVEQSGVWFRRSDVDNIRRSTRLFGYHEGSRPYRGRSFATDMIGVELEIECPDYDTKQEFINEWQQKNEFLLERDGSLRDTGVEIVGPPLTFESYANGSEQNVWPSILSFLRDKKCTSWMANTRDYHYGMHINYSRSRLNADQQALCVLLVNRFPALFQKVAGRGSNTFSQYNSDVARTTTPTAKSICDDVVRSSRKYSPVHVHDKVLEFRLFRGTLNWDGFRRNIQCVQSVVDFVRKCTGNGEVILSSFTTKEPYLEFVQENAAKYPQLDAFLRNKNLYDEPSTAVNLPVPEDRFETTDDEYGYISVATA